jgi:hypothetical protein
MFRPIGTEHIFPPWFNLWFESACSLFINNLSGFGRFFWEPNKVQQHEVQHFWVELFSMRAALSESDAFIVWSVADCGDIFSWSVIFILF